MHYGAIKPVDIADGLGVRVGLYVSGCTRHCPGCHNKEAWDFEFGMEYTSDTIQEIMNLLKPEYISGLSILGGEPLEPANYNYIWQLCMIVKTRMPEKSIWLYTGFRWEEINHTALVHCVDVIVDGAYIEARRDLSLAFRGSSNQRIIDAKKSLQQKKVILYEMPMLR